MNLNHFFFEACAQVAAKHQIKTYVVGGWVRDQLLNRPSKDIDIVVEGNGMDFAQKVPFLLKQLVHVLQSKS